MPNSNGISTICEHAPLLVAERSSVVGILQATLKKKAKEYQGTNILEEIKVSITGLKYLHTHSIEDTIQHRRPHSMGKFDAKRLGGWTKQAVVCM